MHEMSIAESIVDIVRETLKGETQRKLLSVTVEVGELTAVVPESLEFCFQAITAGTAYDEAKLVIREKPLSGVCRNCQEAFRILNLNFLCPACQSGDVQVTGGQELNVTELEVE